VPHSVQALFTWVVGLSLAHGGAEIPGDDEAVPATAIEYIPRARSIGEVGGGVECECGYAESVSGMTAPLGGIVLLWWWGARLSTDGSDQTETG
jgi:hypothetical protein